MNEKLFVTNGKIVNVQHGDDSGPGVEYVSKTPTISGDVIEVVGTTLPMAKWADDNIFGNKVTVSYIISDTPIDNPSAFVQDYIEVVMGKASAEFYGSYSELTGHLWTNQKFVVGGHDIIKVMNANLGKYIHIEVLVHAK